METKMNKQIHYRNGDQIIYGEILSRSEKHVEVRIVYPYVGWSGQTRNTGDKDFRTHDGDKAAEKLLFDGYRKLEILDKFIDNLAFYYDDVLEELSELRKLPDNPEKITLINMLKFWFFEYFMLRPYLTRLTFDIYEIPYFEQVIKDFKRRGIKSFLALSN